MDCSILHLLEGAQAAKGVTVIIDVFRAFSLECYLYDLGAKLVRPVGAVEEAWALREKIPDAVLIGERHGIRVDGFDFGNSPSQIRDASEKIRGKVCIHTTSAGTQGIVNATGASQLLTGSLVNAKAVARYIRSLDGKSDPDGSVPFPVSIVAMGRSGKERTQEDELCAEYIKALLDEKEIPPSFDQRRQDLRNSDGKRFFEPSLQEHFPQEDFHMCIKTDLFPFVLCVKKDELGFYCEKIPVIL
ncbi:MAG: 2-phosphosulfolactate phosphatase [Clostridiales bacterium]|nr:2-phosphosulfolactate phosphatase [Clostridiales bacterium]